VFENFLNDIVIAYKKGSGPIFDAVGQLDETEKKTFINAAKARFPIKTAIDKTVRIPVIEAAVWKYFDFEKDVVYPVLPNDVMYGVLSEAIHNQVFSHVPVSDKADKNYKNFFGLLGKHYLKEVVVYSEMDATPCEDKQAGKQDADGHSDDDDDDDDDDDKKEQ
jgi:hypothetical protein